MTYPFRCCFFARARARALAAVALWSALLSVGTAHGAVSGSVDMSPDSAHGTPAGDASSIGSFSHLGSRSGLAFILDRSESVDRGLSYTHDLAEAPLDPAVVNAAAQPIPEPTEYMLLAGGLLILWGALRWKNRARRTFNGLPRSRPKR